MIALPLALLLGGAAAQAPTPPPAPAWPEGVVAKVREELPLVVAAFSLSLDPPPALLPLVASWLEQPESWPEGPVARLLAAGGSLEAEAHPDGLVVIARGPAERQSEVVAAALAPLSDKGPATSGFEPARAEALAELSVARRDEEAAARRALWREWYGEAAAKAREGPNEQALLNAREAEARAALDEVKRSSSGHRLFLEGAVRPSALPPAVELLRPASAPTGPPSLPRPPAAESPADGAPKEAPRAPVLLVVGHPLPPGPWSTGVGLAFSRALERRLAPLGDARMEVEASRHARLLVVTLRLEELSSGAERQTSLSEVEAAVRAALEEARQGALRDRELRGDLEAAAASLAREERELGGFAERMARVHLTQTRASLDEATAGSELDALVGLLRISVLPEVLRAVRVPLSAPPPASPPLTPPAEGAAPSVASARGRG